MEYKKGFTLMELIVVSGLIALMAALVGASLTRTREQSRDIRRVADIQQLQKALELYRLDHEQYPTELNAVQDIKYINAYPKDPSTGIDYAYVPLGGSTGASCNDYHLGAILEMDSEPQLAGDSDGERAGLVNCNNGASDFNGNTSDCASGVDSSPEKCYDVRP